MATQETYEAFIARSEPVELQRCGVDFDEGESLRAAVGENDWTLYWSVEPKGRRKGKFQLARDTDFQVIKATEREDLLVMTEMIVREGALEDNSLLSPRRQPEFSITRIRPVNGPELIAGVDLVSSGGRGYPVWASDEIRPVKPLSRALYGYLEQIDEIPVEPIGWLPATSETLGGCYTRLVLPDIDEVWGFCRDWTFSESQSIELVGVVAGHRPGRFSSRGLGFQFVDSAQNWQMDLVLEISPTSHHPNAAWPLEHLLKSGTLVVSPEPANLENRLARDNGSEPVISFHADCAILSDMIRACK